MIVDDLLEKLNELMFKNIDFDEILDLRDSSIFDREWNRVYKVVEEEKKIKGYSEENKQLSDEYRKNAYFRVYNLCENDSLAAYISDDFGMICDSELVGYTDSWLEALIKTYAASKIPCGDI
ncbi:MULTISPECIES: hypothetical protein [Clostridium]|uniref:Uncharacterized protein n=2 Tax=Clostridium TaxID=1485 RepID=A0A0E3JX70_CLOSL|nr:MULTISPECIES: hypothetical protein [Clostridium]AKA67830.1 hypothetical protein CSCA_0705 [Clostridium scatologenes]AWI05753.1 hypothetical protein B9W14_15020 [Clostridium drakei]